jgi:hypothetical protein
MCHLTYLVWTAPHRYLPPATRTRRSRKVDPAVPFWQPTSCRGRCERHRRAAIPSDWARTAYGAVARVDSCPTGERRPATGPAQYFRKRRLDRTRPRPFRERNRSQRCGEYPLRAAIVQSRPGPSRRNEWDACDGAFWMLLLWLLLRMKRM